MRNLWWKQWRENQMYLGIFLGWMVLAVLYCLAYEVGYRFRAPVGHFDSLASFYTICAAIFLGMRTTQGEQTEGTLSFSAALPVSLRRMAAVRMGMAVAMLVIPVLVAAGLLSLALLTGLVEQAGPRNYPSTERLLQRETAGTLTALEQLASIAAIAMVGGSTLLLVISLLGHRLRSPGQVGLLGAVVGLGSIAASGMFWYAERRPLVQMLYGVFLPQSLVVPWGYDAEHGGSYTDHELAQHRWLALGLAIPWLLFLGLIFSVLYGRWRRPAPVKRRWFRWALPAFWSYVPVHLPGRWGALIWSELRQSVPLVVFGWLFAVLVALMSVWFEPQANVPAGEAMIAELPHTVAFVGMLWGVVVGSALYSAELGSGLGAFWRSRPISPSSWFWCKFAIGLLVVLAVLDGLTILVSGNATQHLGPAMMSGMSWSYVACFPILHVVMFSLAVFGTCWLRRPVIGGFVAIMGFTVLLIAIEAFPVTQAWEPVHIYNELIEAERHDRQFDLTQHGYPITYGGLLVFALLLAVFSSRLAAPLDPPPRWYRPSPA